MRPLPNDIVYIGVDHMVRACDARVESVVIEPATSTLMAQVASDDRFSEPLPQQPEIMLLLSSAFGSEAIGVRRIVGLTRDCKRWIGSTRSASVTCQDLQALAMLPMWTRKSVRPGACVCSGL